MKRRGERKASEPGSSTPVGPATGDPSGDIERLRQDNERLREENAEQAKRIKDLERQLALRQQNSTMTSKPPSSEGLAGQQ